MNVVFLGVAGLLNQVPSHGNRIPNATDMAIAGAKPLVVVGIVVDLERQDPIAKHVRMIHAR